MPRGHFSAGIKRELMMRSGGLCSNPECRRTTIGPSVDAHEKGQIAGEAAHIKSASKKGPRFDPNQSDAERHSIGNAIWLCERCASLIDKRDSAGYTVEKLHAWKEWSELGARELLESSSRDLQGRTLRTVYYANIPRLAHYAALHNQFAPPRDFEDGVPTDRYIYDELVALRSCLAGWTLTAFDWKDAMRMLDDPTGVIVRFEGTFRTKNGVSRAGRSKEIDFSDIGKAPHIYQKSAGRRLVLPYNPRFLTTSTAGSEFTSGTIRAGGFGHVKSSRGSDLIVTPLYIGHAPSVEAAAFMDLMSRPVSRR